MITKTMYDKTTNREIQFPEPMMDDFGLVGTNSS